MQPLHKENSMAHTIELKVRGYHLDLFGHVNNARYLEFLEEGRWAAFEEAVDLQQLAAKGYAFTVVNINISYRRPALMNHVLSIETAVAQLNRRSGVIHQVVKLKGTDTLIADADVTFVIVDAKTQKAAPLEGDLMDMLKGV
jgi:thioesterase-3